MFFYTSFGFTQSDSGPLGDIDKYSPNTRRFHSDKPNNNTEIDKIPLKCDFVNGIVLNGIGEISLFSFASDKPLGHKIYKKINN